MRTAGWVWVLLLGFAIDVERVAAQEGARAVPATRAGYGVVSAEFMSLAEIEGALPLLAAHEVGLTLAFPSSELENPAYFELVAKASALGVEVRPWLLLPVESGYWPNATNARDYDAAARTLLARWRERGLRPTTLVVDMEIPLARTQRYAALLQTFDVRALVSFLRAGIDRRQYADATRVYRDLVEFAHARGFRVELSTISQVLDDYLDGDDDLRQAFNIPVSGIDWDVYSIQVYRTLNQYVTLSSVGPTTSYYVYDYASRARSQFGARAAVGLGLIDAGELAPDAPLYARGSDLRSDLDAARAAGIARDRIGVYALRGITRRTPSEQWFPEASRFAFPPLPDAATVVTRSATLLLDRSL